jgi:hypothetical protein
MAKLIIFIKEKKQYLIIYDSQYLISQTYFINYIWLYKKLIILFLKISFDYSEPGRAKLNKFIFYKPISGIKVEVILWEKFFYYWVLTVFNELGRK